MADRRPRFAFPHGALRGTQVTFNTLLYVLVPSMAQTDPLNDLHTLVVFIYVVLIPFLQLKYLQNPTLFQVHPKTTKLSIAGFIGYCWAWSGRRRKFAMSVFGSLSFISLVSMVLFDTEPLESLFGFIIYTLWSIAQMLPFIRTCFRHIREQVQRQQMRRRQRQLLPISTPTDLNQLQMVLLDTEPLESLFGSIIYTLWLIRTRFTDIWTRIWEQVMS